MSDFDDEDKGRRHGDRYQTWRPDRPTVVTIFAQLGYNLWDQADVNRLRENLDYSQKARERDEAFRSRRLGWWVSVGIAILSAIATTAGEWIVSKLGK